MVLNCWQNFVYAFPSGGSRDGDIVYGLPPTAYFYTVGGNSNVPSPQGEQRFAKSSFLRKRRGGPLPFMGSGG